MTMDPAQTGAVAFDDRSDETDADVLGHEHDGDSAGLDALRERALAEAERIAEALVFASSAPVSEKLIASKLPDNVSADVVMARLGERYAHRGVNLVRVGDAWAFRTAADLGFLIRQEETEVKKLSRAGLEVLSTIAYHQPVTRAEIEDVRGVATSKGTLDVLMETGWVRMRGRRRTPGRPVTLWNHPGVSGSFRTGGTARPAGHGRTQGRRPPVRGACRRISRFPRRRSMTSLAMTKIRSRKWILKNLDS